MLASPFILNARGLLSQSSSQDSVSLGALAVDQTNRKYRYVRAGGSTLVVGNLLQAAAIDTNFEDMAVQAAVAVTTFGPSTIPVTLGATATTANQFLDGILTISVAPGLGQSFHIVGHDVAASGTCNFYVEEPITTALTTTSKATVVKNPYADVIQAPTAATGMPVGGAILAITNAQFGWVQVGGMGTALSDAVPTAAATMALSQSVTTAGAVTKGVNQNLQVGVSLFPATISAKTEPIYWTLP